MAWKLAQSNKVERVYVAPGNGGTAGEAKCENVESPGGDPAKAEVQEALAVFAKNAGVDLTVVGPEAPLAADIAGRFRAAGLAVTGPGAAEARLESSKVYAKSFMEKYGIRAARSAAFTGAAEALAAVQSRFSAGAETGAAPLVIKADGLAAGKGVVITADQDEAERTIRSFMEDGALGEAGKTLVLEEYLEGREISVLAAVSVRPGQKGTILPFVSARDHKRRFDGDRGPNTGGMGAIAPVPDFNAAAQRDFEEAILLPTLKGMEAEAFDYRGFIFFGLMARGDTCHLLEYNVRLGDPETQAVLPLMDADFAGLCAAIEGGTLGDFSLAWKTGAVCAPVAAAAGYPGAYRGGDRISLDRRAFEKTGAILFAAGAVRDGGAETPGGELETGLRTAGGRVLAVSAWGVNGTEARQKAYQALQAVSFEGMAYRSDIGAA
jgi:phosphoribosylamine--glycine ligase